MTLFIDTSALLRRYVPDRHAAQVTAEMASGTTWVVSAITRTETQIALRLAASSPSQLDAMWVAFRSDWETMAVVPVDDRCLAHAVDIGTTFGLRTIDAIQLAAADRLPRPVRYLTFSRHQLPAAATLGLEVISSVDA